MVSLPDYDPNNPRQANDPTRINRLTTGVFEWARPSRRSPWRWRSIPENHLGSSFDARSALHYGRFQINDYHAQRRVLTVPEIFTYSSNIGTARMALSLGVEHHKAFLKRLGQLDRLRTELPESAEPRSAEICTIATRHQSRHMLIFSVGEHQCAMHSARVAFLLARGTSNRALPHLFVIRMMFAAADSLFLCATDLSNSSTRHTRSGQRPEC